MIASQIFAYPQDKTVRFHRIWLVSFFFSVVVTKAVSSTSTALAEALEGWKNATGCDHIDLEGSDQFTLVWIVAAACGIFLSVLITVPSLLKKKPRAEKDGEAVQANDLAETSGSQSWKADNSQYSGTEDGLSYRKTKNLDDIVEPRIHVKWGEVVRGLDENDGWLRVEDRYLPIRLDDGIVLTKMAWPSASDQQSKQSKSRLPEVDQGIDPNIDPKPDLNDARKHLLRTSPKNFDGQLYSVCGTPVSELGNIGGIGTELYFSMLRNLGICFFYMSMCTLPLAAFSALGNFIPDTGISLTKTSIGNLGYIALGGLPQQERLVIINCQGIELITLTSTYAWMDFLSVFVFIVFVSYAYFRSLPRYIEKDTAENLTAKEYAVEIDCLPRRINQHQEYKSLLKDHLEKILERERKRNPLAKGANVEAKVCEISLVRDYNGRLGRIMNRAKMQQAKDIADYKKKSTQKEGEVPNQKKSSCCCCCCRRKSLEEKIRKESEYLEKHSKQEEERPVLRAYVVLNCPNDVQSLQHVYRFAKFKLFRLCQGRDLRFEGSGIRIHPAPEPSDILWENEDVSDLQSFIRGTIVVVAWLSIMILAFLLIVQIQSAAADVGTEAGTQIIGSASCDEGTRTPSYKCNAVEAMSWTKAYARSFSGDALACYCTTQGFRQIYQDNDLSDICKDWLVDAGAGIALGVLSSVAANVINTILRLAIIFFANWERPTSLSSQQKSIMYKLAISQYLNLAVIVFLVNYNFSVGDERVTNGRFTDFDRGWYVVVGAALISNMCINSLSGPSIALALHVINVARRCCCRRFVKHQVELRQMYTNPPFELGLRYAQLLTTCFCSLTYSSGLPVLNACTMVYCFNSYWADKFLLLRGSCQPPAYDAEMPTLAYEMLLFAGPWHLLVAIYMFSHKCTFPTEPLGDSYTSLANAAADAAAAHGPSSDTSFSDRLSMKSTWMFAVALAMYLALALLYIILFFVGSKIWTVLEPVVLCCCPKRRSKVSPETGDSQKGRIITWAEAREKIQISHPPASYQMTENERFKPLSKFMWSNTTAVVPSSSAP